MQFIIIGRDANDIDALKRRTGARDAHLKNIEDNAANMIMGAATVDDEDKMNGSVMFVEFPTREDLDNWLAAEPYITDKVWDDVQVIPCKIPPFFYNKIKS